LFDLRTSDIAYTAFVVVCFKRVVVIVSGVFFDQIVYRLVGM